MSVSESVGRAFEVLNARISELERERGELLAALEHVMQDDNLIPRATSACRKVVAAAIAKAKG